jgi:hypothetical protein
MSRALGDQPRWKNYLDTVQLALTLRKNTQALEGLKKAPAALEK